MEKKSIFILYVNSDRLMYMGFRDRLIKADLELNMLFRTRGFPISYGKDAKQGQYDFTMVGESKLLKCKSCGGDVSSLAVYCHHCGSKAK
jgi:hypothetical protein